MKRIFSKKECSANVYSRSLTKTPPPGAFSSLQHKGPSSCFCEDGYGGDVVSLSWSFGPTILPAYLNDSKSMKKKILTATATTTAPVQC